MPTKRRRHTITEVGEVEEALQRVRDVKGEPNMRELVVLGAEVAVDRAVRSERDEAERQELRERLIRRMTTGEGIDLEAAKEVRRHGWSRPL